MQLLRTTKPPRGKLGRFKFHGVPADPNRLRLGARGSRFRWRDNGTNLHDQTNPTNQLAKAKLVERRSKDGQARTGAVPVLLLNSFRRRGAEPSFVGAGQNKPTRAWSLLPQPTRESPPAAALAVGSRSGVRPGGWRRRRARHSIPFQGPKYGGVPGDLPSLIVQDGKYN